MFRTARIVLLSAIICLLAGGCQSLVNHPSLEAEFGFLPSGLGIQQREFVSALTAKQAQERQMHFLESSFRVLPNHEKITFGDDSALKVIGVPANRQELETDFPGFCRGLEAMRTFLLSQPKNYPEHRQPDFVFVNAGIYIRSKFRLVDLPWGKAVVMMAQYTQEAHPPPPNSDDLSIWIRAMSHDALLGKGGFCVSGEIKVSHPRLKRRDEACRELDGEDELKVIEAAERRLNNFADESFSPSLKGIERMMRELRVRVPAE